jgi:hypothetical protein
MLIMHGGFEAHVQQSPLTSGTSAAHFTVTLLGFDGTLDVDQIDQAIEALRQARNSITTAVVDELLASLHAAQN